MFSAETEQHHLLSPKDLQLDSDKKPAMNIDIARTTNHTGEQLHVTVPIYGDETREAIMQRLGFAYSIIQERLESENKVLDWQNIKNAEMRRAATEIERLKKDLKSELLALDKRKRKENWDADRMRAERTTLVEKYKELAKPTQQKFSHAKAELEAQKDLPMGDYADEVVIDEGPDHN